MYQKLQYSSYGTFILDGIYLIQRLESIRMHHIYLQKHPIGFVGVADNYPKLKVLQKSVLYI